MDAWERIGYGIGVVVRPLGLFLVIWFGAYMLGAMVGPEVARAMSVVGFIGGIWYAVRDYRRRA